MTETIQERLQNLQHLLTLTEECDKWEILAEIEETENDMKAGVIEYDDKGIHYDDGRYEMNDDYAKYCAYAGVIDYDFIDPKDDMRGRY